MRTWYENEEILRRFRDWLGQTDEELRAAGSPAVPGAEIAGEAPEVGLLQLVEAFTALRHELKLQTKSTRTLEDGVAKTLAALEQAARQLEDVQSRELIRAQQAARPLVEALIELDEALERGRLAAEAAQRQLSSEMVERFQQAAEQRLARLSVWQRWRARPHYDQALEIVRQESVGLNVRRLQPLVDGYRLIADRLQRALTQQQIRRIECVGRQVDPKRMNVVELVDADGAAAESVVDQVRPGYEWQGRVIRYAEVRAARRAVPACGPAGDQCAAVEDQGA